MPKAPLTNPDVKFSNLLGTISARAYIGRVNVKINIQLSNL